MSVEDNVYISCDDVDATKLYVIKKWLHTYFFNKYGNMVKINFFAEDMITGGKATIKI